MPIQAGTRLDESVLEVREVHASAVQPGALTSPEEAVGQLLSVTRLPGDQITAATVGDVAEAAVIGVAHPKWDERPLLVVVRKQGKEPTREAILDYMKGRCAKWWLPDKIVFIDEIPKTGTGKFDKKVVRDQYSDLLMED